MPVIESSKHCGRRGDDCTMSKKGTRERFLRAIQKHKNNVLGCLQSLGNCSDPALYTYDEEELLPIFTEIVKKLAEVWLHLNCHCPYTRIPAPTGQGGVLKVAGARCRWGGLVSMDEVLEQLAEDGCTFAALEPIRNKYNELFENELCWTYPFCFDGHLGCVLLFVREGILGLPYSGLDHETYEQFEVEDARLLTQEDVQKLMDSLLAHAMELYEVLTDIFQNLPASGQHSTELPLQKSGEVP